MTTFSPIHWLFVILFGIDALVFLVFGLKHFRSTKFPLRGKELFKSSLINSVWLTGAFLFVIAILFVFESANVGDINAMMGIFPIYFCLGPFFFLIVLGINIKVYFDKNDEILSKQRKDF